MNLNKAKTEIKKLKKEINPKEEPTMQNFFKFCEKEYGRPANYGEIFFSTYYRDGIKIKSDPVKFIRLSEKYYTEMHQVPNPVKDGDYGMKWRASIHWVAIKDNGNNSRYRREDVMENDKEFNSWFEDAWNEIIINGDCSKYNQLIIDSKNVF